MSAHAQLSPSSAVRWMTCPGSVALSEGIPDTGSDAANEGTMMHTVAAHCLLANTNAADYIGVTDTETGLTLNDDQARAVQSYVDYVRKRVAETNGTLLVEQRVSIEHMTGEEDAHGTADAVIIAQDELIVLDAKFGRGVEVEAEENPQLLMYAHAVYREWDLIHDFSKVTVGIIQPRLGNNLEWTLSVKDLQAFGIEVQFAAESTRQPDAPLVPSPKGCQWCRAKATCPAIRNAVMDDFDSVVPETADAEDLARVMANANMIEAWVKAVRAEVERRLLAGEPVRGYKLVQGKKGNRAWSSAEDAEALLKSMRIKHDMMYDYKLASPTSLEKLAKAGEIGPRQWSKISELITQAEGSPSVAPLSDKRPALVTSAVVSDFDDVTNS
jgi:hypothetical protein